MFDKQKLKLIFCWHIHQPEYRYIQTGEFVLPWTYLHVIKDYVNFERQLRMNLFNLYQLLGEKAPGYLAQTFVQGSGSPSMGGAMRPGLVENA